MLAAEAGGKNLVLYPASSADRGELLVRICRAREVDGILVMGMPEAEETAATLENEGVPFVIMGRHVVWPTVSFFVGLGNREGARKVTRHLIELGHTRIAYTDSRQLNKVSEERRSGYQDALEEVGLPLQEELIVSIGSGRSAGYQVVDQLLSLQKPPTAVFAIHDGAATSILKAAAERGLEVPKDLAVAGYDDIYSALVSEPPLTSIHQPLTQMGKRATETLLERITDSTLPPVRTTLPVHLVVRQSTAGY